MRKIIYTAIFAAILPGYAIAQASFEPPTPPGQILSDTKAEHLVRFVKIISFGVHSVTVEQADGARTKYMVGVPYISPMGVVLNSLGTVKIVKDLPPDQTGWLDVWTINTKTAGTVYTADIAVTVHVATDANLPPVDQNQL